MPGTARAILSRRIWRTGNAHAWRKAKYPLTELPVQCPHCKAALILATVMDKIVFRRRTCPKCGNQFISENNLPQIPDDGQKKPNASVKPAKNARKSGRR